MLINKAIRLFALCLVLIICFALAACTVQKGNPQDDLGITEISVTTSPPKQQAFELPEEIAALAKMSYADFLNKYGEIQAKPAGEGVNDFEVTEGDFSGFVFRFAASGEQVYAEKNLLKSVSVPAAALFDKDAVTLDDISKIFGGNMLLHYSSESGRYAATATAQGAALSFGEFDIDNVKMTSSRVNIVFA